jgi:tetratricopeptide (TPR) repeat protein
MSYNFQMRWNSGCILRTFLAFLAIAVAPLHSAESPWIRLQSANFELYSSTSSRGARDTIRVFEQVRGFFLQVFATQPAKPVPVRLVAFRSPKEFEPYRPNDFAAAYYHPGAGRDYIVMGRGGADIFPVAVHEYVHLLVRQSGIDLPPWLNEGLAELYSTLRPIAGKMLVGDLIPGRYQALLNEKWVPLAVILAADRHSPYYNEKDKAGSLYNEGWALTHMLNLRDGYREKFGQLLSSISGGKESEQALLEVYGRTVPQIEADLRAYLRGRSFQGVLVAAKLDKTSGEIPVEPVTDFDTNLMLTDLLSRPDAQPPAFERLAQQDPKRPEPYRGLGYLAWRAGKHEEAIQQFSKAFERGDRNPQLLWDYGRLLERNQGEEAIRVLTELLSQDGTRVDVRLDLAETQLRANHAVAALVTLAPIRSVTPADSARFFRVAVYAHLRNGDQKQAGDTAKHFLDVAKTDEDRAEAERLVSIAIPSTTKQGRAPAPTMDQRDTRPLLRRPDPRPEVEAPAPPSAKPSASGRFVELDCRAKQPRMIVETATGRRAFLLEVPSKVVILAGSNGPVDMTCGRQKTTANVTVEYDPPSANQTGIDGIVRTLAF